MHPKPSGLTWSSLILKVEVVSQGVGRAITFKDSPQGRISFSFCSLLESLGFPWHTDSSVQSLHQSSFDLLLCWRKPPSYKDTSLIGCGTQPSTVMTSSELERICILYQKGWICGFLVDMNLGEERCSLQLWIAQSFSGITIFCPLLVSLSLSIFPFKRFNILWPAYYLIFCSGFISWMVPFVFLSFLSMCWLTKSHRKLPWQSRRPSEPYTLQGLHLGLAFRRTNDLVLVPSPRGTGDYFCLSFLGTVSMHTLKLLKG